MLSAKKYNALPLVSESSKISDTLEPTRHRLCNIIAAHGLQGAVYVRLIHKHFDMADNEVAVFRPLAVEGLGTAILMSPMQSIAPNLYGKHYLLDPDTSSFVAFEHSTVNSFDLIAHPAFMEEYKKELIQSKASHVFGIGIQDRDDVTNFTEIELKDFRYAIDK